MSDYVDTYTDTQSSASTSENGVTTTTTTYLRTYLRTTIHTAFCEGTNYHIDATGGDDDKDGLTPETAWQTVAKHNISTFAPGDHILFKCGEVWYGENLEVPSSGAMGMPITYSHYGEGANPIICPSIEFNDFTLHSGVIWERSPGFDIWQVFEDNVRLTRNLVSHDSLAAGEFYQDAVTHVIYVRCSDDGNPNTGHIIEHKKYWYPPSFTFNSQSYITVDGIDTKKGYFGYAIDRDLDGVHTNNSHDLILKNCTMSWNEARGVSNADSGFWTGHYDITIDNCVVHDCNGEAFWVGNVHNLHLTNCEVYNAQIEHLKFAPTPDAGGINCGVYSQDNVISGNYLHDSYSCGISTEYEAGYDEDARPLDCIIEKNHIITSRSGITDMGNGTLIRNNWIETSCPADYSALVARFGSTGAKFYHNTVHSTGNAPLIELATCTDPTFKNNIICRNGTLNVLWIDDLTATGYNFDYNDYYSSTGSYSWRDGAGNTYGSLALWQAASELDADSFCDNPDFVTEFTNLHLQSVSPCRDNGEDLRADVPTDYDDVTRDATPDIGAYEYVA